MIHRLVASESKYWNKIGINKSQVQEGEEAHARQQTTRYFLVMNHVWICVCVSVCVWSLKPSGASASACNGAFFWREIRLFSMEPQDRCAVMKTRREICQTSVNGVIIKITSVDKTRNSKSLSY